MCMNKMLKNLFWDSDLKKIDAEKNATVIIERVLELGNPEQIKYLFKNYEPLRIQKVLKESRRLSLKSANFWADYFSLSKKDVLCLRKLLPQTPKNSWPY